jgi:hypothetical protein
VPQQEFAELEQQGIIRLSNSDWSSPLRTVKKPEGTCTVPNAFLKSEQFQA